MTIAIFRNFEVEEDGTARLLDGGLRIPKDNLPIHEFITLISI